jgi:hypothetical protein
MLNDILFVVENMLALVTFTAYGMAEENKCQSDAIETERATACSSLSGTVPVIELKHTTTIHRERENAVRVRD